MHYFLNDTAIGPYSGKVFASKGDQVELISEHGNMAIVEKDKLRFSVKVEKLSKKEVEPSQNNEPVTITSAPCKMIRGKKQVTNPTNNFFGKVETMKIEVDKKGLHYVSNNGKRLTNVAFTKK